MSLTATPPVALEPGPMDQARAAPVAPAARRSTRRLARPALQLLAACIIGGAWLGLVFWQVVHGVRPADYANFYCGGYIFRTEGTPAVYDFPTMQKAYARIFPRERIVLPFIRPPFYAAVLSGLTLMSPNVGLVVWVALNTLALFASFFVIAKAGGMEMSTVAWHAAIFFPAVYSFFNRQDVAIVLLLASTGFLLAVRGQPFLAGLVFSLCAIKFHLFLLLPLGFLIQKNWRALKGTLAGGGALLLISTALMEPRSMADYFHMLLFRTAANIDVNPQRVTVLWNLPGGDLILVPVVVLAIACVILVALRQPAPQAIAAALLGSLLLSPHIYVSDFLLALLPCLVLSRLGPLCLLPSVLLFFPVTPALMVYGEKFLLFTPLMALLCLMGAAFYGVMGGGRQPLQVTSA